MAVTSDTDALRHQNKLDWPDFARGLLEIIGAIMLQSETSERAFFTGDWWC